MSSAMFIHRITPMRAQVDALKEAGFHAEAEQLEEIIRKVERGVIRTVTQLNKAEEAIQWTK